MCWQMTMQKDFEILSDLSIETHEVRMIHATQEVRTRFGLSALG